MFEESPQALVAANLGWRDRFVGCLCPTSAWTGQKFVFFALMWSFLKIVGSKRVCYAVEMPCSEEDEVIQALASQRADEALHERLAIRRPCRRLDDFHVPSAQSLIQFRREFRVAIMLQVTNPQPS